MNTPPSEAPMNFKQLLIPFLLGFLLILPGCAATGTQSNTTFIDLNNGIFQVSGSDLMWQKERSPLFASKEEAVAYVKNLNLGGFTDWRLPTPDEVLSLHYVVDFGKAKEGDFGIFLAGNYWCVLNEDEIIAGSWQDGVTCELNRSYKSNFSGHVRAVRP
ncbi:MAG: DUF1566 domain-containing protein [Desulfobacterales bacterium]|nr:MAG: DUF1566 domain-containing protein [Desulfobacterales bacterium]